MNLCLLTSCFVVHNDTILSEVHGFYITIELFTCTYLGFCAVRQTCVFRCFNVRDPYDSDGYNSHEEEEQSTQ